MIDKTDEEIVARVQKGDTEIFGTLIERFEKKMLRYARKFLMYDPDDAEDVVQEVFIKAYIHIKSFDTKRKFSSWLYRIAHNELINLIKKKGKEPLPFFDADTLFPHPIAKESTDDEMHRKDIRAMVDRGLDKLQPKYREPMMLYYLEEFSYKEIADILKIPTSTVGVRLNRGKALLKEVYKNKL